MNDRALPKWHLSRFRDVGSSEVIPVEDVEVAAMEASIALEEIAGLLDYLIQHRETGEFPHPDELYGLPDNSMTNSFNFLGPDSFRQLADEFERVGLVLNKEWDPAIPDDII